MIRVFTTHYPEPDASRRAEFAECLLRNVGSDVITEVCIILEGVPGPLPTSDKIRLQPIARRPNYEDFFAWINELSADEDVSVIANADIWLDDTIALAEETIGPMECFALARWQDGKLSDRNDSQDCWIFRGKVAQVDGSFPVGVPRCDNRILFELQAAGYDVRNPAFAIRAHHIHSGGRDEYAEAIAPGFVPPPYRYLWPHNLWSLQRTTWHNIRRAYPRAMWRFDSRGAARTFPVRLISRVGRVMKAMIGRPAEKRS